MLRTDCNRDLHRLLSCQKPRSYISSHMSRYKFLCFPRGLDQRPQYQVHHHPSFDRNPPSYTPQVHCHHHRWVLHQYQFMFQSHRLPLFHLYHLTLQSILMSLLLSHQILLRQLLILMINHRLYYPLLLKTTLCQKPAGSRRCSKSSFSTVLMTAYTEANRT